jgi:hypothetical protein
MKDRKEYKAFVNFEEHDTALRYHWWYGFIGGAVSLALVLIGLIVIGLALNW